MNNYSFSDIYVGLEESFITTISSDMLDKFLSLSADCNPLHTDKEYAVSKGFEDKVVYGMLTASFLSTLAGVYLPGRYCLLQGVDVQFSKPVFVGDSLNIHGKVSYINEAYKQIEIKATITNQHNKKVAKALIKTGIMN
jgi:3-hydroxybutyryl-CoA dehydratase